MWLKKLSLTVAIIMLATLLAACASPTPQVVEKVVTQQVEKVVTQQVEKVVEKPVEVTRVVQVTPTPASLGCDVPAPSALTKVNMIGWAFPITQFYADRFKSCNNVKNLTVDVKLLDGPSAQQQVRLALSGGGKSPYAIVHGSNPELIEWGSQGWLLPLNDLIDKYRAQYKLDDISKAAWAGATINGKIYGIPAVGNTLHLQYRADLFKKYNLAVPKTYDDVIAACKVLKAEKSIDLPFTMNLHAGWAWEIEFFHFIRSFGGDYLNADNTPAFNSAKGVAGLTKMKEVIDACMGKEGLSYSVDDSETGLETGRLAFANLWASRAGPMDDPAKSKFVGQIAFAPAPAPNPGGLLGGSAWNDFYSIPAKTDVDPDLVFRIIMEATNEASQMQAAQVGIVTRASVAATGAGGRYLSAALTTIDKGVGIYPPNPAVPLVQKALSDALPLVGTGELTPQKALDQAAAAYTKEATAQGFLKK